MPAKILQHLFGHARADAAGINEPAVVDVIAKQPRAKVRPGTLRMPPGGRCRETNDQRYFLPSAFDKKVTNE